MNPLSPPFDLDDVTLLKQVAKSARALAQLNGEIKTIPNEDILLKTLLFREAEHSSAIENITTTQKELFLAQHFKAGVSSDTKEAQNYTDAMNKGLQLLREKKILSLNVIKDIQEANLPGKSRFRTLPGTVLQNPDTLEVHHRPPQTLEEINLLMNNLETFMNDDTMYEADPLIKMALIHHQFESIHPFNDGNGRMGRILNILYLTHKGLLDVPVLYLSRYIIEHKRDYYLLLQKVGQERSQENWTEWCLWLIRGVEQTVQDTIMRVRRIKELMGIYKRTIRDTYKLKFYSQDLLNGLFQSPYKTIDSLKEDMRISRVTATKYLNQLHASRLLRKGKVKNQWIFIVPDLWKILMSPEKNP